MKIAVKQPYLSIVIPLYNEEKRLDNIYSIYEFLDKAKVDYEIILVNDGSNDETIKKVDQLPKKFKYNLITYYPNQGKGYAIKEGMLSAKGEYRLFTDIDLSTPIEELNKFLPHLTKYDVIIGSRKTKGSNLKKRQPFLRELLGKAFTLFSQLLLEVNVSDFTCGFKCFSKKAAEEIFKRQKISRWGFDSEILYIAKKLRYEIKEIPVNWTDDPLSKVKFPQAIISSLVDLYRIKSSNYV